MQDRPHRRLNLTQPYGQANGATLTAPENGVGDSHEPEAPTPLSVADAVEPLRKSGENRPAYLVVPLDSANEALASAFPLAPPSATPLTTPPVAPRGWLLPTLGGVALGALVVGVVAFRGNLLRATPHPVAAMPPVSTAKKVQPVVASPIVRADAAGELLLQGGKATLHGKKIRQAPDAVGYWDGSDCYVTWVVEAPNAGKYAAALTLSVGENCGGPFIVSGGESRIVARSRSTGGWTVNRMVALGTLTLPKGRTTITVRPNGKLTTPLMVLRNLRLTPLPSGQGSTAMDQHSGQGA